MTFKELAQITSPSWLRDLGAYIHAYKSTKWPVARDKLNTLADAFEKGLNQEQSVLQELRKKVEERVEINERLRDINPEQSAYVNTFPIMNELNWFLSLLDEQINKPKPIETTPD